MSTNRSKRWVGAGLMAAALGVSSTASAQPTAYQTNPGGNPTAPTQVWARDSRLGTGEGTRAGSFELHPGVAGEFTYNSNIYLRAGTANEPRIDAFVLRITPFISLRNVVDSETGQPVSPSYALSASASLSYLEYIEATKSDSTLSDNRNLAANGALSLLVNPSGKASWDLHTAISRAIDPSNLGNPDATFNRTVVTGGTGIIWKPGGGKFSWKIGYDFTYTFFEDNPYSQLNNIAHVISNSGQWQFRPRSTLVFDTSYGFIRYADSATAQPNGDYVTGRLGLNSLLTKSINVLVMGGYGSTMYESKGGAPVQDFDSFLAQVEARFFFTSPPRGPNPGVFPTSLSLGYIRDFQQSYIGNFYQRDRGYGTLVYSFSGKVVGSIGGGISRMSFPATAFATGNQRNDAFVNYNLDTLAFVEYRPLRNLGLGLTGAYNRTFSGLGSTGLRAFDTTGTALNPNLGGDDLNWEQFLATFSVRYFL